MTDKVLRTLVENCGVHSGDKIIVALSGGADSVTLLHLLITLKDSCGFSVSAAHVNHRLRGDESVRDEEFVRRLCSEWGIELFVRDTDVEALAKSERKSVELCGREVRYSFFEELHRTTGAKVATAHTMSDCEETMLYNIARGTTIRGLCSIPYTRDYIIRPLLNLTRQEVEAYCSSNNLEFVQDSTNFDEEMCCRNKIRLAVLPPLRGINSGFDENFARLREDLFLTEQFVSECADRLVEESAAEFGYDAEKLSSAHPALTRRAVAKILSKDGCAYENVHILRCLQILSAGGAVMLPQGRLAVCKQGIFRVKSSDCDSELGEVPFAAGLVINHNNSEYSVEELTGDEIVYRKLSSLCIACDTIDSSTVVRTRREGDTFTLCDREITKPLRKLQNEMKIPAEKRGSALVIARGSTVLWAEYIGVSEQAKMKNTSDKGYFINIRRGE